jgi:hypothetical protein
LIRKAKDFWPHSPHEFLCSRSQAEVAACFDRITRQTPRNLPLSLYAARGLHYIDLGQMPLQTLIDGRFRTPALVGTMTAMTKCVRRASDSGFFRSEHLAQCTTLCRTFDGESGALTLM